MHTLQEAQTNQQFALQQTCHEQKSEVQQLRFDLKSLSNTYNLSAQRETEYCTRLTLCEKLGKEGKAKMQQIMSALAAYYRSVNQQVREVRDTHCQELNKILTGSSDDADSPRKKKRITAKLPDHSPLLLSTDPLTASSDLVVFKQTSPAVQMDTMTTESTPVNFPTEATTANATVVNHAARSRDTSETLSLFRPDFLDQFQQSMSPRILPLNGEDAN